MLHPSGLWRFPCSPLIQWTIPLYCACARRNPEDAGKTNVLARRWTNWRGIITGDIVDSTVEVISITATVFTPFTVTPHDGWSPRLVDVSGQSSPHSEYFKSLTFTFAHFWPNLLLQPWLTLLSITCSLVFMLLLITDTGMVLGVGRTGQRIMTNTTFQCFL